MIQSVQIVHAEKEGFVYQLVYVEIVAKLFVLAAHAKDLKTVKLTNVFVLLINFSAFLEYVGNVFMEKVLAAKIKIRKTIVEMINF